MRRAIKVHDELRMQRMARETRALADELLAAHPAPEPALPRRTVRKIVGWMLLAWMLAGAILVALTLLATASPAGDVLGRWGFPEGTVLQRGHFALAFDGRARTPRWVIEHLSGHSLAGEAERGEFHADETIPQEFRPTAADYAGAGYDKGHMAPAADFGGQAAMDATFTYSNCVPQNSFLNRRLWVGLESHVRSLAKGGAEVWVITCPLYCRDPKQLALKVDVLGPHGVWVPTHVAKTVLVLARGERLPAKAETWIVPNREPAEHSSLADFAASVDELERMAGLDLWSGLPDAVEAKLEAAGAR